MTTAELFARREQSWDRLHGAMLNAIKTIVTHPVSAATDFESTKQVLSTTMVAYETRFRTLLMDRHKEAMDRHRARLEELRARTRLALLDQSLRMVVRAAQQPNDLSVRLATRNEVETFIERHDFETFIERLRARRAAAGDQDIDPDEGSVTDAVRGR